MFSYGGKRLLMVCTATLALAGCALFEDEPPKPKKSQEELEKERIAAQKAQAPVVAATPENKDRQKHIAALTEAIAKNPTDDVMIAERAEIKRQLKDYEGALKDADEALKLKPEEPAYFNARAMVRGDMGDSKGAIEDFDGALRLKPGDPTILYNRGCARLLLEDRTAAVDDFSAVLNVDSHHYNSKRMRGATYCAAGNFKAGLADLQECVKQQPNNPVGYNSLAIGRKLAKMDKEALEAYDECIRLDPKNAQYFKERGHMRAQLGDNKGALSDFDHARKLNPSLKVP